jgi:NAD(P)-dependent dehydrogenase (short-subunit alcohol dehydrogenase family)
MDAGDLERLIAEVWDGFGAIDLLVNNVGHFTETPYLDLPLEEFDHILTSNIRATFVGARAAGRRMKERGTGSIINIAATDAFHQTHTAYGLAKAGVIHLTQGLALELAPQVRVNAIAPDLIADNEGMEEEFVRRSVGGTPLGRLVTRQEIAEVACLLSTSAFASVTGQTLVMDGGRTLPRLNFG